MKKIKRNTVTVRLSDEDHEAFLRYAGKTYSPTLRELIKLYAHHSQPEDISIPPEKRVKTVIERAFIDES